MIKKRAQAQWPRRLSWAAQRRTDTRGAVGRQGDGCMTNGEWFVMHVVEPLEPLCYFGLPAAMVIFFAVSGFVSLRRWLRKHRGSDGEHEG